MALGICSNIDLALMELTLMSVGMWLLLLNGLNVLFIRLSETFRKLTIFKIEIISIFNPGSLNGPDDSHLF